MSEEIAVVASWPPARKPVSTEEKVFGQYMLADKARLIAAANKDKAGGHLALPVLVELMHDDGQTVTYEVIDGPRYDHTCSACREDIAELGREFGSGAIGVFNDSSGGEMERLRQSLNQLAAVIQAQIGGVSKRVDALEHKAVAELPDKT